MDNKNQVKYIQIKDSKNNINIWKIYSKNDEHYWITTSNMNINLLIKKCDCEEIEGSSLLTYKGIVDIGKVKVSTLMDCSRCLYCDKCPDVCKVKECEYFLDYEDERLGLVTEE